MFAVLVYLPGLALETDYLALAASLITFLFTVLEVRAGHPHTDIENSEILSVVYFIVHLQQLLRYFRMWPGGEGLHASLLPLLDSQDSGPLLLSHLYLLVGISLPLWVTPFRQYGHGELQVYTADLYTLVYHQHLIMYSSTYIHTYIHVHTYIHTYIHTCIHAYIHTILIWYITLPVLMFHSQWVSWPYTVECWLWGWGTQWPPSLALSWARPSGRVSERHCSRHCVSCLQH